MTSISSDRRPESRISDACARVAVSTCEVTRSVPQIINGTIKVILVDRPRNQIRWDRVRQRKEIRHVAELCFHDLAESNRYVVAQAMNQDDV